MHPLSIDLSSIKREILLDKNIYLEPIILVLGEEWGRMP